MGAAATAHGELSTAALAAPFTGANVCAPLLPFPATENALPFAKKPSTWCTAGNATYAVPHLSTAIPLLKPKPLRPLASVEVLAPGTVATRTAKLLPSDT